MEPMTNYQLTTEQRAVIDKATQVIDQVRVAHEDGTNMPDGLKELKLAIERYEFGSYLTKYPEKL